MKKENNLIWETYQDSDKQARLARLKTFLDKENDLYYQEITMPVPEIDRYPLAKQVSDNPLVQQYVATRLHYYGGGERKLKAASDWADEALNNPQPLD
jgi:hypothetical protein